jgi:hypothetical protein
MATALERIVAASGYPGVIELLAERLSATDLQTLMLEVYRRRSSARTPSDVLRDYEEGRFFGASRIDFQHFDMWDAIVGPLLAGRFERLLLSPMTPLGTCSAVATVAPSWSVPTARTGEVTFDPTNVLALEVAARRRRLPRIEPRDQSTIHLAATHRVVRPQAYADRGLLAHFSLLALVSGGRDTGSGRFEAEAIAAHLDLYLAAFRKFLGPARLRVTYTKTNPANAILSTLQAVTGRHHIELSEGKPSPLTTQASVSMFGAVATRPAFVNLLMAAASTGLPACSAIARNEC